MFPEMKTTEPYSPRARAKARAKPVSQAGAIAGRTTRRKVCSAARAQAGGRLLDLGVERLEHRLQRPHHEGQADEGQGHGDAERSERDLEAERGEGPAEPAGLGVERGEGDARDGGGQGEGQVHERVHHAPPGEAVAHEHPGDHQAEDRVDEGGGERRAEGEAVGGEDARRGGGLPEGLPSERRSLEGERGQRDEHDQAEVEEREPEGQPEPGEHAVSSFEVQHGGRRGGSGLRSEPNSLRRAERAVGGGSGTALPY